MVSFQIVGVLNVTPDSYFDGGKFNSVDAAVKRAGELINEGADIIDIGGESTGPGSEDVSLEEELHRTIPVIEAIMQAHPNARISIDTWKSEVAKKAIAVGAIMINDVTAGRGDPKIFDVVAQSEAQLVLMYSKDPTPRTTVHETAYEDVVGTIKSFLTERKESAVAAGVAAERIIVDPGMGHFISSDPKYSFEVLSKIDQIAEVAPVFVSPSRKSFLAGPENLPPAERLPGTIAASAIAVLNGASYIRTHDVLEAKRGCEVAVAL